jgi:tRNA threonylcarbamoyl adenosine modification protein YeaZ
MIILATDTSATIMSVALLRDGALLGAIAIEGKGSRNEKLLPALDWLLQESAVDRHDVDLFAVTRGPGSFTGVRIGLATTQGLALALGKPVCAMSTHEAIALGEASLAHPLDRVLVHDDAGRGEHYLTMFEGEAESIAPRLARAEELDVLVHEAALAISVAHFLQHGNIAVACARRAEAIARSHAVDAYRDVTPIYVRLAEAEVKLQQLKSNG